MGEGEGVASYVAVPEYGSGMITTKMRSGQSSAFVHSAPMKNVPSSIMQSSCFGILKYIRGSSCGFVGVQQMCSICHFIFGLLSCLGSVILGEALFGLVCVL